jgi:hypothetical protein
VTIGTAGFKVDAGDPVLIAEAVAKMSALEMDLAEWNTYCGAFLAMVSDPATAALTAGKMADQAIQDSLAGIPAAGVPVISLQSLLSIKAAAAQIQFNLPGA